MEFSVSTSAICVSGPSGSGRDDVAPECGHGVGALDAPQRDERQDARRTAAGMAEPNGTRASAHAIDLKSSREADLQVGLASGWNL